MRKSKPVLSLRPFTQSSRIADRTTIFKRMSEQKKISLKDVVEIIQAINEKLDETNAKLDNLMLENSELGNELKTQGAQILQLSQSLGEMKNRLKPPRKSQANAKTSSRKRSDIKTLKRKNLVKETTFEHGTDSENFYGTSSDSEEERMGQQRERGIH